MRFRSTRGGEAVNLDEALVRGIAADGGLFVPENLPAFEATEFEGADALLDVSRVLLRPFFEGSRLAGQLRAILDETFRFPIPLTRLPVEFGNAFLLELIHGPTAAFKDVGAGFLAACLCRLEEGADRPLTILVATSGDTGGAVAAAFDNKPGVRVVVLFPAGRVTVRQEHQLTCWSDNVLSLAVQGSFDDCQALAKEAMADRALSDEYRLSSANSINIGRLLPQCTYYAWSCREIRRVTGRNPAYIVPTGNLGNAFACLMTREMGLPIGEIVLASNANRIIADYLDGAEWAPRASIPTLATAMDVGNPSNMERLRDLIGDAEVLGKRLRAVPVSDDDIERQIRHDHENYGIALCPHTATASFTYHALTRKQREENDWVLVGTAHAAKFEQIVEPLIGGQIPLPDALVAIQSKPSRSVSIAPDMVSFRRALHDRFHLDGGAWAGHK